jgi:DNA-binding transcriptional MerR regulator
VDKRNITPAQAAALLGVSASTLRAWSVTFADHLSEAAKGGGGRKRTYSPDDLSTLQRAGVLIRSGKSPTEAAALVGVVDQAPSGAALVTLPAIAGELQQAREVITALADEVKRLREQQTVTAAQHANALGKVIADSAALADEVADMRKELDALRGRPWWRRLFSRG